MGKTYEKGEFDRTEFMHKRNLKNNPMKKKSTRLKLSETRKKLIKEGKVRQNWFKGHKHTEESKKKISKTLKKRSDEISRRQKKFFKQNPTKHANIILAKNNKLSKPQKYLFKKILKIDKSAKLNYPIQTDRTVRFADVGIPKLKIDFEYDGSYWHYEKEDKQRDKELMKVGWKTHRFSGNIFSNEFLEEKIKEIIRGE